MIKSAISQRGEDGRMGVGQIWLLLSSVSGSYWKVLNRVVT